MVPPLPWVKQQRFSTTFFWTQEGEWTEAAPWLVVLPGPRDCPRDGPGEGRGQAAFLQSCRYLCLWVRGARLPREMGYRPEPPSRWLRQAQDSSWDGFFSPTRQVTGGRCGGREGFAEVGRVSGGCVFLWRAGRGLTCLSMLQDCVVWAPSKRMALQEPARGGAHLADRQRRRGQTSPCDCQFGERSQCEYLGCRNPSVELFIRRRGSCLKRRFLLLLSNSKGLEREESTTGHQVRH